MSYPEGGQIECRVVQDVERLSPSATTRKGSIEEFGSPDGVRTRNRWGGSLPMRMISWLAHHGRLGSSLGALQHVVCLDDRHRFHPWIDAQISPHGSKPSHDRHPAIPLKNENEIYGPLLPILHLCLPLIPSGPESTITPPLGSIGDGARRPSDVA